MKNKQNKKTRVVVKAKKKATKGAEMTRLGAALRTLGGLGGSAIGGLIGMPAAGSGVGTSLGAALSRWLGSGDYSVSSNSIVSRASDNIPMMHKTDQSVTIRHREFIKTVTGSQDFTVQDSFQINPGNPLLFPWLSTIANRFQEYRIKGMVFHYIPTSGTAISSSSSALGAVMLQTSYRANDSPPSSKAEVLNEYWSSESVPSQAFCHPIECDPKENPFNVQYVRNGALPSGDNILLYDLGTTHVCTQGMQSPNVVGDLWVSYEIELKKPIIDSNVTRSVSTGVAVGVSPTSTALFPQTGYQSAGAILVERVDSMTLRLPAGLLGDWLTVLTFTGGTNTTAVNMSGSITYTNADLILLNPLTGANQNATIKTGTTDGIGGAALIRAIRVRDRSLPVVITFPTTFSIGSPLNSNFYITPYDATV